MSILLLVLAAIAVGLLLGLLGGGGALLAVPVFSTLLGYAPKEAIAMSLLVVATVSLVGAVGHWRAGNVAVRPALTFGAAAMLGALLGARLATMVSGAFQLIAFATVALAAATFMLRGRAPREAAEPRPAAMPVLLASGLGAGTVIGLVGVGGGFMIVPALVVLAGLPFKRAAGTSLLVIAASSAVAFAGYLGQVRIAWGVVAGFIALAVVGSLTGVRVARHVRARALQRGFGIVLLLVGMLVLYENRTALGWHSAAPDARGAHAR